MLLVGLGNLGSGDMGNILAGEMASSRTGCCLCQSALSHVVRGSRTWDSEGQEGRDCNRVINVANCKQQEGCGLLADLYFITSWQYQLK